MANEFITKVQFSAAGWMQYRCHKAAQQKGLKSVSDYARYAVCEALARDLGLDLDELLADQPASRATRSGKIYGEIVEEVR